MDPKRRYMPKEELNKHINVDLSKITLCSTDSYSDEAVLESITNSGADINILFACALNMAVIGFGKRKLGKVIYEDVEIDIQNYLNQYNIILQKADQQLKPTDLTPNRLCRLFRHNIQDAIKEKFLISYLQYKYSSSDDYADTTFRCSEYLDLDENQATHLLDAVKTLSAECHFDLTSKVLRVFKAKQTKFHVI